MKIALVPVLGQLMMSTNNKDTIEKCRFQMKSLMDDRALSDTLMFTTELITVFGKLAPKSDQSYREDGKNNSKIEFTDSEIEIKLIFSDNGAAEYVLWCSSKNI